MRVRFLSEFLGNRYVLLGLLLRFLLSMVFAHDFDVNFFLSVARIYYHDGTLMLFVEWAYPAVYFLILLLSYFPADLISDPFFILGQSFSLSEKFFLKLPFNLSDLGVAYLIFRLLMEEGKDGVALPLSLAYWLNPLSVFVSAVHGQCDSLSVFFAVLGFYHLCRERWVLGGLELALSFGVKYQSAVLFPAVLLFLWGRKREALKFTISFLSLASLSLLPFALFYYEPNLHLLVLSPSLQRALSPFTTYARGFIMILNPNMTYYSFLVRCGFTAIPFAGPILEVAAFTLVFSCVAYFAFARGVFKVRYGGGRPLLAAYFSAAYIAAFLSIIKMSPHYALWALPFLLLLYADRQLERNLLFLFNFIPLCDYLLLVNTIFYYVNGGYATYGGSSLLVPAFGLIFSLVCLGLLINVSFHGSAAFSRKPLSLAAEKVPDTPLLLPSIIAAIIVVTSLPLSMNGILWSQYPILPAYPLEETTYPAVPRLIISFLVCCLLVPAFLLTVAKPLLAGRKPTATVLRRKSKLTLATLPLAFAVALASWIISETLPYVASGLSHALTFTPSPSALNPLCANGGILVNILILLSLFAILHALLDHVDHPAKGTLLEGKNP